VQNNTREGIVDAGLAVVFDETQFSEFVHEELTRDAVVPIISASVSCDALGSTFV
jgi:hypothetical protein